MSKHVTDVAKDLLGVFSLFVQLMHRKQTFAIETHYINMGIESTVYVAINYEKRSTEAPINRIIKNRTTHMSNRSRYLLTHCPTFDLLY